MLEDWLLDGEVILRQGATYTWPGETPSPAVSSASTLAYTLVMSTPVQQGIAVRGQTKLYISAHPSSDIDGSIPPPEFIPDMVVEGSDSDPSDSSNGDFEIGEDFLAGSVLRSVNPSISSSSMNTSVNGNLTNGVGLSIPESTSSSGLHLASVEWTCRAHALQRPLSVVEDECAVYVRTADLGRIGVLDGDWVWCIFNAS